MVYAADQFLRNFLGISSVRNPGILNNKNHEDPTYPIFHIKFAFNPPEAKHPDYVTNRLLSNLENDTDTVSPESAIKFLYNVGEPERALMLKKFNITLKSISEKTPWYFQSVAGIDSLYKHGYENESRGTKGLTDASITISTLDSIDFRLTALKDLYRKAAYDRKYRRWILPVNMRRFRMSILVGDYRQMAITEDNYSINPRQALAALRDIDVFNASNIGGKLLGKVQDGALSFVKRLQWWDNHFSCLVFDCQDCEFDMNSFDSPSLSHERIQTLKNSFKIKIGRVLETNTYSLLEYSLSDNLIENFLKSENKADVITRSKNLSEVLKPKVGSWKNYQNLEREKGDSKRVILDDGGFSNALGAGINEAASFLGVDGVLGGTNLGSGGGIGGTLGSIVDFAGDTASEIAQEALGLATEQIASNVYGNELTRSIAGVGLGILNGDLNQVAQNFSNPALAGALGINVESSGRPIQPNLRDGVPSKLDLVAPSVQKSLSDVQANLTGEGADPRFQSIGRPGQSLFNNPLPNNRLFDQKNIDLRASRVETEMPDNVEFTEVRKETKLNPNKESLTGATPKNSLDESSVKLQGAGKQTDLTPNSAELTGAQPLKDLNPNNAELTGADPLKDLVPNSAELTGAQPLKDLNPNSAELTGADPLKDLVPSNAELTGATPQQNLNPNSANLTGATPLKDLNPNSANLTGNQALKSFNETNANLEGASALNRLNSTNVDLQGAEINNKFDSKNVELSGSDAARNFSVSNEELIAPDKKTSFDESNVNFEVPSTKNRFDESNVDLEGSPKVTASIKNADLVGVQPITKLNDSNAKLTGYQTKTETDLGTETLNGNQPLRTLTESNVGNMTVESTSSTSSLGKEELTGRSPIRDLSETNVSLTGYSPKTQTLDNIELKGANKNTQIDKNVNLEGKSSLKTMDDNVDLKSKSSSTTTLSPKNVGLQGQQASKNFTTKNVELEGIEPSSSTNTNIYQGQPSLGVLNNNSSLPLNSVELRISKTIENFGSKNIGLD